VDSVTFEGDEVQPGDSIPFNGELVVTYYIPDETAKTPEIEIPVMSGTNIDTVTEMAKAYGVKAGKDEDFGHGTMMRPMQDDAFGLTLDVVYSTSTKEVLGASFVCTNAVSESNQKAFVKGMAAYCAPSDVAVEVSNWVSEKVGSTTEKVTGGFTFELSRGPTNNILYYAGNREWEDWEISVSKENNNANGAGSANTVEKKKETSSELTEGTAIYALAEYAKDNCVYKLKVHYFLDCRAVEKQSDGSYYIKIGAEYQNEYKKWMDCVVEGVVCGTDDNPLIKSCSIR